jgi:hypothetical protein
MELALLVGTMACLAVAIYEINRLKKDLKYTEDKLNELFRAWNRKNKLF